MNKKSWLLLIIGVLLVFFIVIVGSQSLSSNGAPVLSQKEALEIVDEKYPGKIMNIILDNEQFVVNMERNTGIYQVILSEKNGAVLSVKKIKEYEVVENPAEIPKEEEPAKIPQQILTEQDAIRIALEQVSGTIDDVEWENREGVLHYYIEVEADTGEEALIEINSITGEVQSITWED